MVGKVRTNLHSNLSKAISNQFRSKISDVGAIFPLCQYQARVDLIRTLVKRSRICDVKTFREDDLKTFCILEHFDGIKASLNLF